MIKLPVIPNVIRLKVAQAEKVQGSAETYDGEYTVTPQFDDPVILETKDKLLTDDVTVNPIEVFRTSNPSGGKTIYIGGNING